MGRVDGTRVGAATVWFSLDFWERCECLLVV